MVRARRIGTFIFLLILSHVVACGEGALSGIGYVPDPPRDPQDGDITQPAIECDSPSATIAQGNSTREVAFKISPPLFDKEDLDFSLTASPAVSNAGTLTALDNHRVRYQRPASVAQHFQVDVTAKLRNFPEVSAASCRYFVARDNGFTDDHGQIGLVGNVYHNPDRRSDPPASFDGMTPFTTVSIPNLAYERVSVIHSPINPLENGQEVFTYYLDLNGKIAIPESRTYEFYLWRDDGMVVSIDGSVVVGDFTYRTTGRCKTGSVYLTQGLHDFNTKFAMDNIGGPANFALYFGFRNPGTTCPSGGGIMGPPVPDTWFGRP